MIQNGKRSIVVVSSKRKGIGPKVGSIGYVVGNFHAPIYVKELGVYAALCEVLFTRYGFEKSEERMEKKHFINVFPANILGMGRHDPTMNEKDVETLMEAILSVSPISVKKDICAGVMVPLPNSKIDENTIAWLISTIGVSGYSSMIKSIEEISVDISNYDGGNTVSNSRIVRLIRLFTNQYMIALRPLTGSKNRVDSLHKVFKVYGISDASRKSLSELIRVIQMLSSMQERNRMNEISGVYALHLSSGLVSTQVIRSMQNGPANISFFKLTEYMMSDIFSQQKLQTHIDSLENVVNKCVTILIKTVTNKDSANNMKRNNLSLTRFVRTLTKTKEELIRLAVETNERHKTTRTLEVK